MGVEEESHRSRLSYVFASLLTYVSDLSPFLPPYLPRPFRLTKD